MNLYFSGGCVSADLLPALKSEGSLGAAHWFPASIRGYICPLRGSRGGQRSSQCICLVVVLPASHAGLGATTAHD